MGSEHRAGSAPCPGASWEGGRLSPPFPRSCHLRVRGMSPPGHRGCSWRGEGVVSLLPVAPLCQQERGAVVTSLSPWLSHLCPRGYLRAGGDGGLQPPAAPGSRCPSQPLRALSLAGTPEPGPGDGSCPSIIDGEAEPSAAAGSGYTAGTGRGQRAGVSRLDITSVTW